jgi:hypothetical protein
MVSFQEGVQPIDVQQSVDDTDAPVNNPRVQYLRNPIKKTVDAKPLYIQHNNRDQRQKIPVLHYVHSITGHHIRIRQINITIHPMEFLIYKNILLFSRPKFVQNFLTVQRKSFHKIFVMAFAGAEPGKENQGCGLVSRA